MKKTTLLLALCCAGLVCSCATEPEQDLYSNTLDSVCPDGLIKMQNTGAGDPVLCCPVGTIAENGLCVDAPMSFETNPDGMADPQDVVMIAQEPTQKQAPKTVEKKYILLSAPNGKGSAYCREEANSLAWDGKEFKCCGKGLKSVAVPSRDDSICCPEEATDARWVGLMWNDYACCPKGTVEVKNYGSGDKYICCKKGQKAQDGECFNVQ